MISHLFTSATDYFSKSQLGVRRQQPGHKGKGRSFLQVRLHVWSCSHFYSYHFLFFLLPFYLNSKPESKLICNNGLTKAAVVLAWTRGFQVVARCRLSRSPASPEPWRSDGRRMMKSPSKEPLRVSRTEGRSVDGRNLTPTDMSPTLPTRGPLITSLAVRDGSPLRDYILKLIATFKCLCAQYSQPKHSWPHS